MPTAKEIKNELGELYNFKDIVSSYEEIAASRMRRVKNWVLQSRDFLSGLTNIFEEVKSSYKSQLLAIRKRSKKSTNVSLLTHNGKTITVLVSANTRLYGSLIKETFDKFAESLQSIVSDIIVIGRVGRALFEEKFPKHPFTYYELSDQTIASVDIKNLVSTLVAYDNIFVFYGEYQDSVNQAPTVTHISSDQFVSTTGLQKVQQKYIFEPSVERLIQFFETEIFASLFEQTIQESQLAKFASRMVTLDKALDVLDKQLANIELIDKKFAHQLINKKQQEAVAGLSILIKKS